MKGKHSIRDKASVEQDDEQRAVDEQVELRATVELETQAKIDSDVHEQFATAKKGSAQWDDAGNAGEVEAREMEKRRTHERADREQTRRHEELCER